MPTCKLQSAILLLTLLNACTNQAASPSEPAFVSSTQKAAQAASNGDGRTRQGFSLRLNDLLAERGAVLGAVLEETSDGRLRRTIGAEAVFTEDTACGAAGMFATDQARFEAGPFGTTEQEHAEAVMDLFLKLGLPEEQLGEVRTNTIMGGSGFADEANVSSKYDWLAGRVSRVERYVDGVHVVDSIAIASINRDGQLTHLQVFWPEIADVTVQNARGLERSSIRADLPAAAVVIRHTPMGTLRPHEARAVFERPPKEGNNVEEHFDGAGRPVALSFLGHAS